MFWFLLARLAGLSSVGAASSIVSAAMMPAAVLGAGFGLAAARRIAAEGPRAACSLLAFSLLLAALAAASSTALAVFLDAGGREETAAAVLGFLMTAGGVGLQLLLGMEMFGAILAASLAGNTAKIAVGVAGALAGMGEEAVLAGFAAAPATTLLLAGTAVLRRSGLRGCRSPLREARGLLGLGVSNTLYASSSQLPVALGVYLYAALGGEPVDTGALYLGMMAAQVLAMPASSLAAATLPSSVQQGKPMAPATLRLGLAVATPLAAAIAASPQLFYSMLGKSLASPENTATLQVLVYTAPLLAALDTALIEFNRRAEARPIAMVSATRLVLTAALLPPLAAAHSAPGAAATLAALALAATETPTVLLDTLRAEAALLPALPLQGRPLAVVAVVTLLAHVLLYPSTRILALLRAALRRGGTKPGKKPRSQARHIAGAKDYPGHTGPKALQPKPRHQCYPAPVSRYRQGCTS